MTNTVIPLFKTKDEIEKNVAMINELKNLKEDFLKTLNVNESKVFNEEQVLKAIKDAKESGQILSFASEQEATIFASYVILLPENENVSHFDIRKNISRKSMFFTLEPVYKDGKTSFVFPTEKLLYGINLLNIDREINRLSEEGGN